MYGGEKQRVGEKRTNRRFARQFANSEGGTPSFAVSERPELAAELQKYLHVLGPRPKRCLETLADLGLSDDEIGRYFRMPCNLVTELRDIWKIDGNT
jgi:hypothetical protein